MQYVTTFPQMNSGSVLSLIRSWARGATLFLIFSAAAAAMSSCNMSGGPASTSDNTDPSTLAPGTINYARNPAYYPYGSTITPNVLNSTGTITSATISPALPTGLTFNSANGTISGTPTTMTAAQAYTIRATNAQGTSYVTLTLAVTDQPPVMSYALTKTLVFTKGSAITDINPTLSGGTTTSCNASPSLPAGLSLDSLCKISGTPTAIVPATNYAITASNGGGSSSLVFNFTVKDVAPLIAYTPSGKTFNRGQAITTWSPSNTGGTIVSCSSSPTLPTGLTLSSTCQITGTPTANQGSTSYNITATNSGGSNATGITIAVQEPAPNISYVPASRTVTLGQSSTINVTNTGGVPVSCTPDTSLPTGLTIDTNCKITGTPTGSSTTWTGNITATNGTGSSSTALSISVVEVPPNIAYSGSPYTFNAEFPITAQTPTNSGGPISSCSSSPALPVGLSISGTTCTISGTPTTAQTATTYTITASNTGGSSTATISITIQKVAPNITYTGSPYTYTKGTAITNAVPVNSGGTPTSCTSNPTLPAGLSLSSACVISGTPTSVATATNYSITATNAGGSSTAIANITVNDVLPAFSYSGGPFVFTKGTLISTMTPTNTGGTITSCTSSPTLPAGLSLSSTCVISGTPAVLVASTDYTISGSNSAGTATTSVNITVKDVAPTLNYAGSPFTYTQGVTITDVNPITSGGAITSCSSGPTLPTGLNLSSTCVISGTPTVSAGATNYTVTATNSGGSASKTISITVNPGPPVLNYPGSPYVFNKNTSVGTITPSNVGGATTSCSASPGLPAGLSLSTSCVITGSPTAASSATNYTITGTNAQGSSNYVVNIRVDDLAPSIGYTPSSYVETLRTTISNITPSNSGGAIGSCSSSPTLPAGLSLSSSCVISGTPTATSAATDYTITATNGTGTASAIVNIRVKNLPKIVYYSKNPLNGATNGTATGSSNIWTVTVDGVDKVALTQNTSAGLDSETPNFSADGANITYHSKRALNGSTNGTATSSFNLWNMLSNGTSAIHPTSNTSAGLSSTSPVSDGTSPFPVTGDESPRFSPDGTKIVFASKMALSGLANGTATSSYNIWVANADGTGLTHLTANTFANRDSIQPVFGPSNSVVYFVSKTAQNGSDNGTATSSYNVWKVNTDGTGRTPLTAYTSSGYDCYDVSVSPDGTMLAYASHAYTTGSSDSNINIWTMGTNGANNTRLTSNSTGVRDSRYPSYSPDGSEIVFSSLMRISGFTTSSYNIWKMDSSGANQVALTTNTSSGSDSIYPAFSPDNTKIVFTSTMDIGVTTPGSYNIWVMNSDGTGQNYLTANTNSGLDSLLGPGRVWFAE